jgi:hypothetical protein
MQQKEPIFALKKWMRLVAQWPDAVKYLVKALPKSVTGHAVFTAIAVPSPVLPNSQLSLDDLFESVFPGMTETYRGQLEGLGGRIYGEIPL